MTNICEKTKQFNASVKKWAKIIHENYAIVGSDGSVNPNQEQVRDDCIYVGVHGLNKIIIIAKEYRKLNAKSGR